MLSRKKTSAKYLAEKLELSVRTIYRYIICIELANIPVVSERGKNGGLYIPETFKLPYMYLTETELKTAIDTLGAFEPNLKNQTIESIIFKLKALSKQNSSAYVAGGDIMIDSGPWGNTEGYKNKIEVIQTALKELKVLRLKYFDRSGEISERDTQPHVLVFKKGEWYIYSFCLLRREFRMFKISRIMYASIADESFVKKEVLPAQLEFGNFESAAQIELKLEVEKEAIFETEEWLGVENIKKLANGKFTAEAYIPYDKQLISKIIYLGGGVKIISPEFLKKEILNTVNSIITKYE